MQTINVGKTNWIGYVLRRNCLLKDLSEGKIKGRIKVTGRRGRRRAELLDYLKGTRGYWKLKAGGSSRSHCVWNWLWESLWTCRKTDYGVNG